MRSRVNVRNDRDINLNVLREIFLLNSCENFIVNQTELSYIHPVNRLTKQEQLVICVIAGLLLLGWAVKSYRLAHPPTQTAEQFKP